MSCVCPSLSSWSKKTRIFRLAAILQAMRSRRRDGGRTLKSCQFPTVAQKMCALTMYSLSYALIQLSRLKHSSDENSHYFCTNQGQCIFMTLALLSLCMNSFSFQLFVHKKQSGMLDTVLPITVLLQQVYAETAPAKEKENKATVTKQRVI